MNKTKISEPIPFLNILFLILVVIFPAFVSAQSTLSTFLDSAMINNPEAASIHAQIQSYQYDNQMIEATLRSPKAFLSSDMLIAPYLNNGGNLIATSPSDQAIGYDSGITNGGLYSMLFNLELPVLKGKQVAHLQEQNQVETDRLKTQLKLIENELKRTIGGLYFDALVQQATVESNKQNNALLNEEFQLVKTLTNKGLYRISDYKLIELELKSDSINLNSSINDLELIIRQLKVACGIRNLDILSLESPAIEMSKPDSRHSLFIRSFAHDSLATAAQQKVFNDRYLPQLNVFANSGLNSNSIPNIQRHFGASAGLQLTYNFFDGHQRKINQDQQQVHLNAASVQKELKLKEVGTQAETYLQNIIKTEAELAKQKKIQAEYKDLFILYQDEVKRAQISVINLIALLQKRSEVNLAVTIKEITIKKLINEYNYWNH
jgi:outer membrane protein TolC